MSNYRLRIHRSKKALQIRFCGMLRVHPTNLRYFTDDSGSKNHLEEMLCCILRRNESRFTEIGCQECLHVKGTQVP